MLAAVGYLNGATDTPPPPLHAVAVRDSEAVDLVLAERIHDVRALLSALPFEGRERVGQMLVDVGRVMARNLDSPLPRAVYSEGVLGRVVLYACALVAEDACPRPIWASWPDASASSPNLANDLRDGELALYGAGDREELTRAVMLRLLAPALGGFALLARLGPAHPQSRRPGGDGLHDHHDDRFPVRRRRGARRPTGGGCGSARPCWPPAHPFTGPRCWSGCGVAPTGRSTGCSMRHRDLLPRPARCRVGPGCGGARSG